MYVIYKRFDYSIKMITCSEVLKVLTSYGFSILINEASRKSLFDEKLMIKHRSKIQ